MNNLHISWDVLHSLSASISCLAMKNEHYFQDIKRAGNNLPSPANTSGYSDSMHYMTLLPLGPFYWWHCTHNLVLMEIFYSNPNFDETVTTNFAHAMTCLRMADRTFLQNTLCVILSHEKPDGYLHKCVTVVVFVLFCFVLFCFVLFFCWGWDYVYHQFLW